MSSVRGTSLLRASPIRLTHFRSSQQLIRPSLATYQISSSSRFEHIKTPQHVRPFSWQSGVETAIDGAQSLIVELHTVTHLPWFLCIPLTGFCVSVVFRLPFTIYTQRILQRRAKFTPILQAWNARLQRDVYKDGSLPIPVSERLSEVKKQQDKVLKRIYRKMGLQTWRLYASFLSFPFWLLAIDGVRRLCGGPRGLLGNLFLGGAGSDVEGTALTTPAVLDPSLAVEGCLWFPDLTASDPYHILPFALSASLLWNILPPTRKQLIDRFRTALGRPPLRPGAQAQARAARDDAKIAMSQRFQSSFHLAMIGLSALVGPLTMDLPAALHLYWIASSATNGIAARALKKFMPVKPKLQKRCTGLELPVIRPQR